MSDPRRTVGARTPSFWVVTQLGLCKEISVRGPDGGAVQLITVNGPRGLERRPVVSQEHQAAGWMLLRDAYAQDSREDVRRDGMRTFLEHQAAIRRGGPGTRIEGQRRRSSKDPDKYGLAAERTYPIELAPYWLPEEVVRRRQGRSAVSAPEYVPPKAPGAPKARASKKKAGDGAGAKQPNA